MRVQFKREDGRVTVIEVIQMIRFDSFRLGLIMPDSTYLDNRNYDYYQSTTEIVERDYIYWCDQLMRNGYLDLTRSDLVFSAYKSEKRVV